MSRVVFQIYYYVSENVLDCQTEYIRSNTEERFLAFYSFTRSPESDSIAVKRRHFCSKTDAMDVDFLSSRLNSAKLLTSMEATRLNSEHHLSLDDSEGDDVARASFPCPFCYVDIEVSLLCTHLQEEHCFDVKNSVCPLCAANLGKDMIGHFIGQHSHMLKRRRKSQRLGLWPNSSAVISKELRELCSFLGITSKNDGGCERDSATDPLLSPFLSTVAIPDTEGTQETCPSKDASTPSDIKRTRVSTLDEDQELDYQERSQRAKFFQQLVMSTIF